MGSTVAQSCCRMFQPFPLLPMVFLYVGHCEDCQQKVFNARPMLSLNWVNSPGSAGAVSLHCPCTSLELHKGLNLAQCFWGETLIETTEVNYHRDCFLRSHKNQQSLPLTFTSCTHRAWYKLMKAEKNVSVQSFLLSFGLQKHCNKTCKSPVWVTCFWPEGEKKEEPSTN